MKAADIIVILGLFVLGGSYLYDFIKEDKKEDIEHKFVIATIPEFVPEQIIEKSIEPRTDEECRIEPSQLDSIRFSYEYGQPYDFGYTLAAIALRESNAGVWKINIQDPGGGLYHVGLDKVLKDKGWEDTNFNKNRAMQLLVDDDQYAAELAVQELSNWKRRNSTNWLDVWASYHRGWSGPTLPSGKKYAEEIRANIQKIRYCQWVVES